MVVAAEFFKSAGAIPSWARAELESWHDRDARPAGVSVAAVARG